MVRTYTMRLKATRKQDETLQRLLAQLCELYNMALQQRRDVWKSHGKSFSLYDQYKQLTELRSGVEEYAQGPLKIQRDPLRRLDLAFKAFFRRIRNGAKPGFPRFRARSRYDSFIVAKDSFHFDDGTVSIVKLGTFRVKTGCRIKGEPVELCVKRHGDKWSAHLTCDIGEAPPKVAVSTAIGVDLGITSLATLSDGTEIVNPRWTKREEDCLAAANRDLDTKKRGSSNRRKSRERLRRVHQRIAGKRNNYLTRVAKELVDRYDLIAHEDLDIKGMAQSRFAKSILDAAWAQLIWRLQCEAEKAGKWVVPVNPRGTTINCSRCGERVLKKLSQRQHDCPHCGVSLGRDHNAALNVLALGMSAVERQKLHLAFKGS